MTETAVGNGAKDVQRLWVLEMKFLGDWGATDQIGLSRQKIVAKRRAWERATPALRQYLRVTAYGPLVRA